MADVSKLLHTTTDSDNFLENLFADATLLREAKAKIRAHLRKEFGRAGRDRFGQEIRPRFFTQGSSSYRTLNDPAWPPGQQKDLDDGCYLPLSFVRGERPSRAAALFFEFVDAALGDLAEEEGWTLVRKPTCVRLEIADDAHVDVPLYAIPDREFLQLEDRATQQARKTATKVSPDHWEALPSDAVLLAHREEGWKESDPRKIHKWFIDAVDLYGECLRRDCRFLKAWRDHHHLDDLHLSSILLMACAWTAYEAMMATALPKREDERLLSVAERLPAMLRNDMPNPACKSENLNRMSPKERESAATKAEELRNRLKEAVGFCSDKRRAVDLMRLAFGERVPDRPDQVSLPVAAQASINAHPKKTVPAPVVGRSRSG
ncbi:Cyclic GMP-AMP synthase [Methylorubrum aminovorans]|uniref:Cyclic GMP-AMP synthase n=1 Tax=Methylorubrum aminovorans TaxID=269069 RepID=A0ABQ4UFC1_9HYPH|nr:hypothetical protein [Methylorubrum aminovorans]GJE65964.1 Cyclic GMP-AMP synthase [Methylorubrum aminovorans]GMA77925.1 cyclic GMP-AMP synthase [Methylorubrum aminovorans]